MNVERQCQHLTWTCVQMCIVSIVVLVVGVTGIGPRRGGSVTKFDEFSPLWRNLKNLGHFWMVCLFTYCQIIVLTKPKKLWYWVCFYCCTRTAKYWSNNLAIWSHCGSGCHTFACFSNLLWCCSPFGDWVDNIVKHFWSYRLHHKLRCIIWLSRLVRL